MVEDGLVYLSGHLHDFAIFRMHDMYTLHQGQHLEIGTVQEQTRAVDPGSLNPDPAFEVNPDPIRIQGFDDQKLKDLYLIKICSFLMSKLQEKPSALKREHPALQKVSLLTFFYVCG